jgi:hypothetical protein
MQKRFNLYGVQMTHGRRGGLVVNPAGCAARRALIGLPEMLDVNIHPQRLHVQLDLGDRRRRAPSLQRKESFRNKFDNLLKT